MPIQGTQDEGLDGVQLGEDHGTLDHPYPPNLPDAGGTPMTNGTHPLSSSR